MSDVDFSYYSPVNDMQREYHTSPASHRLLIGGFGAGKTYPSIHEALFHCMANPGHEFAVFRNTRDSLRENIENDFVDIAEAAGAVGKNGYQRSKHNLTLVNGCRVLFRPLTLGRKDLKGMNLCGLLADDPDVKQFEETLSFLFSRLRNPANAAVKATSFKTLWTANWEGKNWLTETFGVGAKDPGFCDMGLVDDSDPFKGRKDPFAYWICPTTSNPTLSPDFIADMRKIHSDAWMDRYVYMRNLDVYSGLVYPTFSAQRHNKELSWVEQDKTMIKFLAVDVGFGTTTVIKVATDGKAFYVYGEWVKRGIVTSILGEYLRTEFFRDNYRAVLIDPSAGRKEQGSGMSIRDDLLRTHAVHTVPADNAVNLGVMALQDAMLPASGEPYFFMDFAKCPVSVQQMSGLRWKEPKEQDVDNQYWSDKPVKKDDHCPDAIRYGFMAARKFMRGAVGAQDARAMRRQKTLQEHMAKCRTWAENPKYAERIRMRAIRGSVLDGRR